MTERDKRWLLRFENFEKAFSRLQSALKVTEEHPNDELFQAGLIQTYEFTFELAWKTLKDYLEAEGFDVPSPRKTIRQAFQAGYLKDGEDWLKALDDRNRTAHAYGESLAKQVIADIRNKYEPIIKDLYSFFKHESKSI